MPEQKKNSVSALKHWTASNGNEKTINVTKTWSLSPSFYWALLEIHRRPKFRNFGRKTLVRASSYRLARRSPCRRRWGRGCPVPRLWSGTACLCSSAGSFLSRILGLRTVFRIHYILVWIRIPGSADPCLWLMDPDPAIFVTDLQGANKKLIFKKKVFLPITFWRYIYITKYLHIQSTTVYVPSSELGLPQPLCRKRVCPPPDQRVGGGAHPPAPMGVGEFQFRRWRKSLALCLLCDLHHFSKIKSPKEEKKTLGIKVFLTIFAW
jgi:hypothetical protein